MVLANDEFRAKNPEKVAAVMRAIKRGADDIFANPKQAWLEVCKFKKTFRAELFGKIYERCFPFMSRDLRNVKRDWVKVSAYCHRIGVCDANFTPNYTKCARIDAWLTASVDFSPFAASSSSGSSFPSPPTRLPTRS